MWEFKDDIFEKSGDVQDIEKEMAIIKTLPFTREITSIGNTKLSIELDTMKFVFSGVAPRKLKDNEEFVVQTPLFYKKYFAISTCIDTGHYIRKGADSILNLTDRYRYIFDYSGRLISVVKNSFGALEMYDEYLNYYTMDILSDGISITKNKRMSVTNE